MKLPRYSMLKIQLDKYTKPIQLIAEWVKDDVTVCGECRFNIDGICTNIYGMYEHGVDAEDYCSRGKNE